MGLVVLPTEKKALTAVKTQMSPYLRALWCSNTRKEEVRSHGKNG